MNRFLGRHAIAASLLALVLAGCSEKAGDEGVCGNGVVEGNEQCDEGGDNSDTTANACRENCTSPSCGDGVIDDDPSYNETCDPPDNMTCGPDCQPMIPENCGDGVLDPEEVCDDGNNISGDGCSDNCRSDESCGNSIIDTAAGEDCDDGNTAEYDGCGADCQIGPFQVNTWTGGEVKFSRVAVGGDGSFIVVWQSNGQDGSGWGVYSRRFDSSASPVTQDARVNTYATDDQTTADVAMGADASYVVVWTSEGQDGDGMGVVAKQFTSAGDPVGNEFVVNTYTTSGQGGARVAVDPNGAFVVVWSSWEQDGSSSGVYGQRFSSGGIPEGGEFQINTYTDNGQFEPKVDMADDGSFAVVWSSSGQDGRLHGVYARRYASDGTVLSSEVQVNTYTDADERYPDVAVTGAGEFVVSWVSYEEFVPRSTTFTQRFASDAIQVGGEFEIDSYQQMYPGAVAVGVRDDGSAVVVWFDYDDNLADFVIRGQQISGSNTFVGTDFIICPRARPYPPALAMRPDGGFVVVWEESEAGPLYRIVARRYDAEGNPQLINP